MATVTPYKLPKQKNIKAEHTSKVKKRSATREPNFSSDPVDHITGFRALDPLLDWPSC